MIQNQHKSILALMPAYNEEKHIADVVTAVQGYLPTLVVDDGSGDNTIAEAEKRGAYILRQSPNQGKGAALRAGFKWAIDHNYQAVLTLDADGQHEAADIPKFLAAYQARQADLIVGERQFRQMPLVRRIANMGGRWLFSWAVGQPVRDNQSGYRLISSRLMQVLGDSQLTGFEFEVEMITMCVRHGFKLDGVPIRTIYANETSHINPIQHTLNFLQLIWHTRRNR